MRTTRWLPALLGLVVGLLVLPSASVAFAQARELGSPYPPGAQPPPTDADLTATPAVTPGAETPIAPVAPASYGDVSVPTPPPAIGVYPAPRLAMAADSPSVHIGTSIALRLRALDADLQILAARGGGNVLDGVLMLVSAAATVTWGVLLQTSGGSEYAAIYLYTYGGAAAARAILSFALMTNPSGAAIRYSHMPMSTPSEVRERLRYGELQVDALADQARLARVLDGSLSLLTGLAVLPAYLIPNNFQVANLGDWFIIVLAGISSVMGVVTLVSTTEAERRQAAYHDLRDRVLATPEGMEEEDELEREAQESASSAVSVSPLLSFGPTGGFAGATLTF